jgi:hypothetical protein
MRHPGQNDQRQLSIQCVRFVLQVYMSQALVSTQLESLAPGIDRNSYRATGEKPANTPFRIADLGAWYWL